MDASRSGTVEGNAKWETGKIGGALEFDGQTFVPLGETGSVEHDGPFSFSAWVFLTSNEPSTVLSKMDEVNACISANADMEELLNKPETVKGVVRVSGPLTMEGVISVEEGPDTPIGGAPETRAQLLLGPDLYGALATDRVTRRERFLP